MQNYGFCVSDFFSNTHYHKYITSKVKIKGLYVALNLIATKVCASCQRNSDIKREVPGTLAHSIWGPGPGAVMHASTRPAHIYRAGIKEPGREGDTPPHLPPSELEALLHHVPDNQCSLISQLDPSVGQETGPKEPEKWTSHHTGGGALRSWKPFG